MRYAQLLQKLFFHHPQFFEELTVTQFILLRGIINHKYLGFPVHQQDKYQPPYRCRAFCVVLSTRRTYKTRHMNFAWTEPKDCSFSLTEMKGFDTKTKQVIKYPNRSPAMRPIPTMKTCPYFHLQKVYNQVNLMCRPSQKII